MTIYDISLSIKPGMVTWPGDPQVSMQRARAIAEGDHVNVTHLALSVHTGTHVDAPFHFLNDRPGVESLDLEVLTGACYVTQLPDDVDEISAEFLERMPIGDGTQRLLFGTSNSRLWSRGEAGFDQDFVALTVDGAEWLVAKGIRLVGTDGLSIAPFGDSIPVHKVLLGAGVVVLEGLDLSRVPRGFYQLYCLPLKLVGADGAPARVILIG